MSFEDRVPAAGTLDRHVVHDDVAVHLIRARRDVHLEVGLLRERDGLVDGVGRVAATGRVGAEQQHVRGDKVDLRRCDQLGVHQVDDGSGRVATGWRGEPHRVARLVRLAEQEALLVVEVVRAERRREGDRGARNAAAFGRTPVRLDRCRQRRVVGERVRVIEPGVLRGQRHGLRMVAVDRDVKRRSDAATGRRIRNAVAHRDGVGRLRQREVDVLSGRETDRRPAGGLGRQCIGGGARTDDRAVGGGRLGLLLDERYGCSAIRDERRIDGSAGGGRGGHNMRAAGKGRAAEAHRGDRRGRDARHDPARSTPSRGTSNDDS